MSEHVGFLRRQATRADDEGRPQAADKLREIAEHAEAGTEVFCQSCWAKFVVRRTDMSNDPPRICPYCGGDLPMPVEEAPSE